MFLKYDRDALIVDIFSVGLRLASNDFEKDSFSI
jgi:hypothetical protein